MSFLTETNVRRRTTDSVSKRLMVTVRIRPLKASEIGQVVHAVDDKTVLLEENEVDPSDVLRQNRGGNKKFEFDSVLDENTNQEMVYNMTTSPLVRDVLKGFNATIFAYGATGSGKTYTMLGTSSNPGIMVRSLNELFQLVEEDDNPDAIGVTMSYLEIYNENIRDLLNPGSGHLELREDHREKSVKVVKLTEVNTKSTQEVMKLLQKGNRSRTMESTAANQTSSRSHAMLSVTVRHTSQTRGGERLHARVQQGRLFMIDLAGSERASQTLNRGKRLKEGAHINRSLLALANCINALSGGARYVNYRDSKLTRLLKDALSGNSKTCMIAHVSPASNHREETKNTLLYADRARNITNKVGQNVLDISYHVSQYRTIISELREEISRLRNKMAETESEKGPLGSVRSAPAVSSDIAGRRDEQVIDEESVQESTDEKSNQTDLEDTESCLLETETKAAEVVKMLENSEYDLNGFDSDSLLDMPEDFKDSLSEIKNSPLVCQTTEEPKADKTLEIEKIIESLTELKEKVPEIENKAVEVEQIFATQQKIFEKTLPETEIKPLPVRQLVEGLVSNSEEAKVNVRAIVKSLEEKAGQSLAEEAIFPGTSNQIPKIDQSYFFQNLKRCMRDSMKFLDNVIVFLEKKNSTSDP